MSRCFFTLSLAAFILSLFVVTCWAHKVQVFAYADQGRIYAEAYFADGSPVKQGMVTIYDGEGKEIGRCETNSEGLCDVALPGNVNMVKVVIDAGMGHRGEYVLKGDELK
ncbi:hypothetical protein [Thermodesulforhabdus norvegica]|uniref:Nickel transport protein n=1 Tax=Thermodesulforhabdus norvegica TaxID=39841 RepID=A0A1I4R7K9_9BACT|nr:hypothetical protein [Thermodesulforhabdus norvegica]SFM48227.1 nickel transport protein [Thermodesulforhabdus norvegica]